MGDAKKLALIGMSLMLVYLLWQGAAQNGRKEEPDQTMSTAAQCAASELPADRDCEVSVVRVPAAASEDWEESFFSPSQAEAAVEMTIAGTALIKNETAYPIDAESVIAQGTGLRLPEGAADPDYSHPFLRGLYPGRAGSL